MGKCLSSQPSKDIGSQFPEKVKLVNKNNKSTIDQHIMDIVFGYINDIHQNIPTEIKNIILMYYGNPKTLVYVIGKAYRSPNINVLTLQNHKYQIQSIYNGRHRTIYADYNHRNYCMTGDNSDGQCGTILYYPTCQSGIMSVCHHGITIKKIFTNVGTNSVFWMDRNNKIYGGGGSRYQLGLKEKSYDATIREIPYLRNIKDIQCALSYALCLDNVGNVYFSGKYIRDKKVTKKITKIKNNIIQIRAGEGHSLFLSSSGVMYCSGNNNSGELGLGHTKHMYKLKINQYFKKNNINIIDMSCGLSHNLCIDINHKIYCFGRNFWYECGDGTRKNVLTPKRINALNDEEIIQIKCGSYHSYALSLSGNHYLWGSNQYHQCIVTDKDHSYALSLSGNHYLWDSNQYHQCICIVTDKAVYVKLPYLVNEVISKQTNHKRIKDIFLGFNNTQIIVIDD